MTIGLDLWLVGGLFFAAILGARHLESRAWRADDDTPAPATTSPLEAALRLWQWLPWAVGVAAILISGRLGMAPTARLVAMALPIFLACLGAAWAMAQRLRKDQALSPTQRRCLLGAIGVRWAALFILVASLALRNQGVA